MSDQFDAYSDSPAQPARRAVALTPHDSEIIDPLPKAIYVGTGGTLTGRAVDSDADVTFTNLASGQILDVRLTSIRETGTTAGDLVGLA